MYANTNEYTEVRKEVSITMSLEEAQILLGILGKIWGNDKDSGGQIRNTTDAIWSALIEAGVTKDERHDFEKLGWKVPNVTLKSE